MHNIIQALHDGQHNIELKLIGRLRTSRWTLPDYWQTDNSNGLVTVIRNYHWLNSAIQVLISTCSAPLVQTGECKQLSLFDLDLWPTTLIYNPRLAKVNVDPHAKNHVQRSNGSNRRALTDKQTDTRMLPNVLPPPLRSRSVYDVVTCVSWYIQEIHYPRGRMTVSPAAATKVGRYPVTVLPGQFQDYYRQ